MRHWRPSPEPSSSSARGSPSGGIEIVLPTPAGDDRDELKVYISGAVRGPGVYEAEPGARLEDVLRMAGGPHR